jgi:hypothetical protein
MENLLVGLWGEKELRLAPTIAAMRTGAYYVFV